MSSYLTYKQILVCLAIVRLGSEARSCTIANLIVELTGRHETTNRGIYSMIDRLRWNKYILTKYNGSYRVHYMTKAGLDLLQLCLDEMRIVNGREVAHLKSA